MTKIEPPDYGGIFLDPDEINYEEIDRPIRNLISLMNCQPWVKTYGCCAGCAHHREDPENERRFFIGLLVEGEDSGANSLQSWVAEANRLNGPTGLSVGAERVHQHPFGQGSVDGWYAYRVEVRELRRGKIPRLPQSFLRMIKSLETAWEKLWPDPANPQP
jgi:hypothetical protein